MSNESDNSNVDVFDEELVAYLDNELEPTAAQRIENLLASDGKARERLSQLAASWDLLDQLPRATVDDLFTRTTVEMVAVAAEEEVAKAVSAQPAKRRLRLLGAAVAAAVALAVGFVAVAMTLPDRNEELLHNLSVVQNLDSYRDVGDIELLKLFQQNKMFTEDAAAPAPTGGGNEKSVPRAVTAAIPIPDSMEGKRGWVESKSAAEKTELRRQFEKFIDLSESDQKSLKKLDADLRADSDAAELRKIMARYHDWLGTFQLYDRAELSEKNPTARVAAIKQLQQDRERWALSRIANPQGPGGGKGQEGFRPVLDWAQNYVQRHKDAIVLQLPAKSPYNPNDKKEDRGPWGRFSILDWEVWRPDSPVKALPALDEDEKPGLQEAIDRLSADRSTKIKAIRDPNEQLAEIRSLVQIAMKNRLGSGPGMQNRAANMKKFVDEELTDEQKAELQGLTGPDRAKKQLEFFLQKHQDPNGGRRGGGPPRMPPDGPRDPSFKGGPPDHEPPPHDEPPKN